MKKRDFIYLGIILLLIIILTSIYLNLLYLSDKIKVLEIKNQKLNILQKIELYQLSDLALEKYGFYINQFIFAFENHVYSVNLKLKNNFNEEKEFNIEINQIKDDKYRKEIKYLDILTIENNTVRLKPNQTIDLRINVRLNSIETWYSPKYNLTIMADNKLYNSAKLYVTLITYDLSKEELKGKGKFNLFPIYGIYSQNRIYDISSPEDFYEY